MSEPTPREGDVYSSEFGNLGRDGIRGSSVEFGSEKDHHIAFGDGFHHSWDTDPMSLMEDVYHLTIHGPGPLDPTGP